MLSVRNISIIIGTVVIFAVSAIGVDVFSPSGYRYGHTGTQSHSPKIIAEKVLIEAGIGTLRLNRSTRGPIQQVSGHSDSSLYITITPRLIDTSYTVYYYGAIVTENGSFITIKSSGGTADTGYVNVLIIAR